MKDRAEKTLYWILWIIISGFIIHGLMSLYFYNFYQHPSVKWETTTFPLLQNTLRQGDPIIATVKRCSKENYQARVSREIVDTFTSIVPTTSLEFKAGCITEQRILTSPANIDPSAITSRLQPGTYYVRNFIEIDVRWLFFHRTDKYETRTESFTIIEK